MNDWERALISPHDPIARAIEVIDEKFSPDHKAYLPKRMALITDSSRKLLGVVTDGDVRKAVLQGSSLEDPVEGIMNRNFCHCREGTPREKVIETMRDRGLGQMPILDAHGCIIGLELLQNLKIGGVDNWVVIMAGGLGTRLGELTKNCPKPLIEVSGRPVIETILTNFIDFGFKRFFIIINYLGQQIVEKIGDGSKWGVKIEYCSEEQRYGTAGGLSLLPERPQKPLIVINCDVLTTLSILHLLDFHRLNDSCATMCVRQLSLKIPFGVARVEESHLLNVDEKPMHKFFVNAGIYVLSPETLGMMPKNTRVEMTDFFNDLVAAGKKVMAFPIREYWIDIGRIEDLTRARSDYDEVFK
jgi:dTDP-glucose pyrophosphorylase